MKQQPTTETLNNSSRCLGRNRQVDLMVDSTEPQKEDREGRNRKDLNNNPTTQQPTQMDENSTGTKQGATVNL